MKLLTLEQLPFSVLHQGFLAAFSDYNVKMEMSELELRARLRRIAYYPLLSGGVLDQEKFCGFIFTGIGEYQHRKTAYNGGTGVIPSHRGQQLGTKIYNYLIELYRENEIEQCLLEVITDNEKAVSLYKKLGFETTRLFKCFSQKQALEHIPARIPLHITPSELNDWNKFLPFCTTLPSWQNTFGAIMRDMTDEIILEAYSKTELIGFMSFNDRNGKISQLAVAPNYRRAKVGSNLILEAQRLSQKPLAIVNVEATDQASCGLFTSLGFANPIDQYEMLLTL